jgi:hypothetical protein
MSVIFPKAPAKTHIHLLPRAAEFISYNIVDFGFTLKAWMPSGYSFITNKRRYSNVNDQFYYEVCSNCQRNTDEYFNNKFPDIPNIFVSSSSFKKVQDRIKELNDGDCNVRFKGFRGQKCPLGKTIEPEKQHAISNSVFVMGINYKKGYVPTNHFNAHLRAGDFNENGDIISTVAYRMPNVHEGTLAYNGQVCFGSVNNYKKPKNLREFSTLFFSTQFNNDLLKITTFIEYCKKMEELKKSSDNYSSNVNEKFICAGYDALMLIDADKDIQAFYTMLLAGFRPIPEIPQMMIVPLEESTIQKDDNLYFGYLTKEDSVGRQWYVTPEGFIIGQLDDSIVKVAS